MGDSWYVESILRSRDIIRSNVFEAPHLVYRPSTLVSLDATYDDSSYSCNFDDDDYNNLLVIEKKIYELFNKEIITNLELSIINIVGDGKSLASAGQFLDISRATISKIFSNICDRIAYTLGGIFTNDGYLDYMKDKYNLTDIQLDKAKEYIESKYRHTNRSEEEWQ